MINSFVKNQTSKGTCLQYSRKNSIKRTSTVRDLGIATKDSHSMRKLLQRINRL